MKAYNSIFCTCDSCTSDINYGDTILEICLIQERHEEKYGDIVVSPLRADILLMLCNVCANRIEDDFDMWKQIKASVCLPLHSVEIYRKELDENFETCGNCGELLHFTDIRYTIDRTIGKIEWNPMFNMGDMTVTDGLGITSYCYKCGPHMDSDHLQALFIKWIKEQQVRRGLCHSN